jgi:hypothetical protein
MVAPARPVATRLTLDRAAGAGDTVKYVVLGPMSFARVYSAERAGIAAARAVSDDPYEAAASRAFDALEARGYR